MPSLDRTSPIPLYHQLKQALMARLKQGEFRPDRPMPTETELMRTYRVSRITVRQAMQALEQDGLIYRVPGRGTFAKEPKISRRLTRLSSFSQDMQERNVQVASRLLDFRQEPANGAVAEKLDLAPESPVWFIRRLRLADGGPVAVNLSYVRLPRGQSITVAELETAGSLWALLEEKEAQPVEADQTLEAIAAQPELARLLDLPVGAPILLVEGVVYTRWGVPVEYFQVFNRGDRYKFVLHRTR